MNGKGDKRRKRIVDLGTYSSNWDRIFGDKPATIMVEVCECGKEVGHVGEDILAYCEQCDDIVEGRTKYITEQEYRNVTED